MKEKAEYKDYRDYFKDLFLEKKKDNKIYSYQYCALKLKVSGSYLKLVFKKSRHISLEKLSVLSTFFGLTLFEKQWITHLFLYNTCEERELKKYFKTIVSSCLSYQSPTRQKTDELFTKKKENEVFCNWLLMAVYNSIGVVGFEWNVDWIFDRLLHFENIQKQDVKNSMKKLIELKFVTVNEEGIAKKNISDDHKHVYPWDLEEFSRFKLGHIKSAQAVDLLLKGDMPSPGRFQMSAFHVNEKDILDICQMYDEIENKIRMIALSSVEPTRVLMTSNNLFSLTKRFEKV
jgi:uncharacterized protein (TIGR02147 family)